MAAPQKDGLVWRHRFMLKGERLSGTFSTKAAALAWESQQRTRITAPVGSGKTCGDAFIRYSVEVSPSKRGERWELLRLTAFGKTNLAKVAIRTVTTADVAAWRDHRLTVDKVATSTVNRELNLLSHVFNIARKEWGWLDGSPTKDVRRPPDPHSRDRRINDDEIQMMCHALGFDELVETKSQAVAAAFLFAIETAMREGEIANLRKEYLDGPVAHLPASICKNGHKRSVPLSKRALAILALLPAADPLFGVSAASIDALFRKARKLTPIENLHFHDTRHEAITRLSKKMHVLQLAKMVGHRDIKQLMTYFDESAADVVALLD